MSSDRLIDALVADLRPVRGRGLARDAIMLALLCGIELGLYLLLGYARPDIDLAIGLPSFWWKLGSLGPLSVVAAVTALRSFRPDHGPGAGLRWVTLLIAASLLVGWLIGGPAGQARLLDRLMWRHGIDCVVAMTTLSVPPTVALALLMRRGAATRPRGSALAVGIAGAAWGAFVFAFNCPHDDPLYLAVWYLVGCAITTAAARLILPRLARW